jgi:sulfide:quinone oxidoreductase
VRRTKVIIAGGGVAALEALMTLHELASGYVDLELVTPTPEFAYRPLAVAEPFGLGEARRFDVVAIARDHGSAVHIAGIKGVDTAARSVHTWDGRELPFDVLLVAIGARAVTAIPGSVMIQGPGYTGRFRGVLKELVDREVRHVAFALPPGASWPLPLYELALLTAVHLADAGADVELELVTPELRPLQLFGTAASDAAAELLERHRIGLRTDTVPLSVDEGVLRFVGTGELEADRVVALPRIEGPRLPGVPYNSNGFVPVDEHGRVRDVEDVFAAGDLTNFPIKQGGLAAQQADAAAEAIAAAVGVDITPAPFTPVLRGLLLTGLTPRFMRTEVGSHESELDTEPLWWPPGKIVGRYLAPFLASHLNVSQTPPRADGVEVNVELDRAPAGDWASI